MRHTIGNTLSSYVPLDDLEMRDIERLRDALEHGDVTSRHQPLHATASALVVHPDSRSVLLRWHTRMHQWMQVGGHFDPGESDPLDVALREAREETGLEDLEIVGAGPVHIAVVPVPAHGPEEAHEHGDIRYTLITANPERTVPESDDAKLRWVDCDAARTEITEPNLLTFLERTVRAAGLDRREATG